MTPIQVAKDLSEEARSFHRLQDPYGATTHLEAIKHLADQNPAHREEIMSLYNETRTYIEG